MEQRWTLPLTLKVALFNYAIFTSIMLLFLFGIAFCIGLMTVTAYRNLKRLVLMWCKYTAYCMELGRLCLFRLQDYGVTFFYTKDNQI